MPKREFRYLESAFVFAVCFKLNRDAQQQKNIVSHTQLRRSLPILGAWKEQSGSFSRERRT